MQLLSLRLAIARIRKDGIHFLTLTLSVLLAFLSLFALDAVSASRESSIANYSLDSLPVGDRTITASSSRLITDAKEMKKANDFLLQNSQGVIDGSLTPLVLLHQLADAHGVGFYLGSLNEIPKQVHLLSGRFPNLCTSSRCEVLQIGGINAQPRPTNLGVVVVGKGTLRNNRLFQGTYSLDKGVPLLLSEGIGSLNNLRDAQTLQGTNGWVADLNRNTIQKQGIALLIERTVGLENRAALFTPNLSFTWPQDAITEASESALLLRSKINSIGHSIEILLLFFLSILVMKKRVDHLQFRSGLSRLGTPPAVIAKEVALEFDAPVFIGATLAVLLSPLAVITLQSLGIESSFSQALSHWSLYIPYLLALLFLLPGSILLGDISWGRKAWIPLGLALGSFGFFLGTTPDNPLVEWKVPFFGATSSILLALIAISAFGWVSKGRLPTTFLLLKESISTWRSLTAVTAFAIFLTSLSLAFSAGVNRNIEIETSNQVPLDIRVSIGSSLQTPLDLGSVQDYSNILRGSMAYPVLRTSATLRSHDSVSDSVQVLGIPTEAISIIQPRSSKLLSTALSNKLFDPLGISLVGARKLTVTLTNIPPEVDLRAWFITPHGAHVSSTFQGKGARRTLALGDEIPADSSLLAFEFQESSDYVSRRLHAQGEGDFQVPVLTGTSGILHLQADGKEISLSTFGRKINKFRYSLNGDSLYLHAPWALVTPLALVDPATAALAKDHILTLSGDGGMSFQVKIARIQPTFPSAGERFIVTNLGALQSQLAQKSLGTIDPIEVWIKAENSLKYETAFKDSHLGELSVQNHEEIVKKLRANPAITGLQFGYRIGVGFAGVLALILILSALPQLRREKMRLLMYLDALGEPSHKIRRALRHSLTGTVLLGLGIGSTTSGLGTPLFLSESAPWKPLLTISFAVIALSEIGSRLYLRGSKE